MTTDQMTKWPHDQMATDHMTKYPLTRWRRSKDRPKHALVTTLIGGQFFLLFWFDLTASVTSMNSGTSSQMNNRNRLFYFELYKRNRNSLFKRREWKSSIFYWVTCIFNYYNSVYVITMSLFFTITNQYIKLKHVTHLSWKIANRYISLICK